MLFVGLIFAYLALTSTRELTAIFYLVVATMFAFA